MGTKLLKGFFKGKSFRLQGLLVPQQDLSRKRVPEKCPRTQQLEGGGTEREREELSMAF